jgi:hypothetical protein
MKDRISTHYANDDWRLYEFTRQSGLRHGDFRVQWWRQIDMDHVVFGACIVAIVVGLLAAWAGEMMQ